MPKPGQILNGNAKEVAAVMKAIAKYHDELTPDDAFEIAYAFCDLLHECSVDEVIRCFNAYYEKDEEDDYDYDDEAYLFDEDDEPEEENVRSIQSNGVVNIPSDCTNFLFNLSNHGIREDAKLYIYPDPEDDEAFIIVAEQNPIFSQVGKKNICSKALNDEFFSIGFQNRKLNPTLRRLKVMMKTINDNRFGIDFASIVKFDKCWRFDVRRHMAIPAIKVAFFEKY